MMTSKINSKQRHKARCFAVQALYQWQLTNNTINDILLTFLTDMNPKKTDTEYFQYLIRGVPQQASELDAAFQPHLDRDLSEIGPVELAILRLGTLELTQNIEIPYKVVLNEAVELAKKFGPEDSHKYINGVLDKVAQGCREVEINAQ